MYRNFIICFSTFVFLISLGYADKHGEFVPPKVQYPAQEDKNGNFIADTLDARGIELSMLGKETERVAVIVDLSEKATDADINSFKTLDGKVGYIYQYIAYGWSGNIPSNQLSKLAKLLGKRLIFISEDLPGHGHLDMTMQIIRNRPYVWNKGYIGDSGTRVAVLDSGMDFSHTDLSGKEAYWFDAVPTESFSKSTDQYGHGTFVAGIIGGTGAAYGSGPFSVITTTFTDKLPAGTNIGYFDVIDVQSSGTFSQKMYFNGAGTGQLSARNTGNNWMHYINSASQPFSWTTSLTVKGLYKPFAGNVTSLDNQPYADIESFPYNGPNDGYNLFKGAASGVQFAAVKVIDQYNFFSTSWVLAGMDTTLAIKSAYNIQVANFSGGLSSGATSQTFRDKANNMVANGIVLTISAGNDSTSYTIPDPGLAGKAITVGATNNYNRIAFYSSHGSPGSNKPDVVAPGGGGFNSNAGYFESRKVTGPDTNHSDGRSASYSDKNANDYTNWSGTSFAAPHVAGLAAELIQAWGSSYIADEAHALKIKGLILMTAYELNTTAELSIGSNPTLNRGSKDTIEGYGRINADAAIESLTQYFTPGQSNYDTLGNGNLDKKVWARRMTLSQGTGNFVLNVPSTSDYDLYLYSWSVDTIGEPIILAISTTATTGGTESISYTATSTTFSHLVVKWVSGYGSFTITSNGPLGNTQIDNALTNLTTGVMNAGTAYNGGRRMVRDGNGYLHVVFTNDSTGYGMGNLSQIWYSYSLSPGTTSGSWSIPVNISQQPFISSNPSIAIDSAGERLYVVWQCKTTGSSNYNIWFTSNPNTTPGTSPWATPSLIWDTTASKSDSLFPVIDVSADGIIHVVWQEMGWESIYSDILYAQSRDTGNTWVNTAGNLINIIGGMPNWPDDVSQPLWNGPITIYSNSQMPSIANTMNYSQNGVHIVWNEDTAYGGGGASSAYSISL